MKLTDEQIEYINDKEECQKYNPFIVVPRGQMEQYIEEGIYTIGALKNLPIYIDKKVACRT